MFIVSFMASVTLIVSLAIFSFACEDAPGARSLLEGLGRDKPHASSVTLGSWRAILESPGGELPFELEFSLAELLPNGQGKPGPLLAMIRNGKEMIATGAVELTANTLTIHLEPYDSRLVAKISPDGNELIGHWEKMAGPGRETRLGFQARAGVAPRFARLEGQPDKSPGGLLDGRWRVNFSADENIAIGIFKSLPGGRAEGTFLTTLGDYRYLAGSFDGKRLRLSCFDGGHAFLFDANLNAAGEIVGDFWSRDSWHETWTASKDAAAVLPDSFGLSKWKEGARLDEYRFPNANGELRSLGDPEFRGKAGLIAFFGTWCPNCNDEAAYLVELEARYRQSGLKVLGVAFELDDNLKRSAAQVDRYQARHGADWPVLFAATADKADASSAIPALDQVRAFPTVLFVDSTGTVRAVHTGYAGPATGAAHERMRERYEALIEELLAE